MNWFTNLLTCSCSIVLISTEAAATDVGAFEYLCYEFSSIDTCNLDKVSFEIWIS